MRKKIIAGNYKMNYTANETENFINEIKDRINVTDVDVVVCPNFTALDRASDILDGTNIYLGAQNVYFEDKGAYTGEVSPQMLYSLGVTYCIIGHSERRNIFKETDKMVNLKAIKLLEKGIKPIICVGENLKEREENIYLEKIEKQVKNALKNISKENIEKNIIIAYEPIWAIGTGKTATKEEAEEICKYIRLVIEKMFAKEYSDKIRILYGGSVNSKNTKELLEMPNIDGALVGGASLKEEFVAIVNY